jgi:DNA-directed RNA polymerase specialized sigma24 family protein
MKNMTDQQLLKNLAEGDKEAMQSIIKAYWRPVSALIKKHGGSESDAEDVFMDGLEILLRKANDPTFFVTHSIGALLMTVCKYKWLNILHRKKIYDKKVTNALTDGHIDMFDVQAEIELQERISVYQKHWNILGERCKHLLTLALEGNSIAEITALLGFSSEGYTRKRKHNCKEKLIRDIQNDPYFNEL